MIRPLGPGDAAAYRGLRVRALTEHPEAFGRTPEEVPPVLVLAEQLRAGAEADADVVLGAFDGAALVGTAGCHRERTVKQRHIAYLGGVYVAPERRRAGLGGELTGRHRARPRVARPRVPLARRHDDEPGCAGALRLVRVRGSGGQAAEPQVGGRYYDEELMVLDLTAR